MEDKMGKQTKNVVAPSRTKKATPKVPGTQALRKGLDVLNIIANANKPLRFKDLLELSRLPNPTLSRLLQTLVEYRLVHFEDISQTYRLGARSFEMAHRVWEDFDLKQGASPELDRLFELLKESVRLGVLENDQVLVVDSREAAQALRVSVGMGLRLPPHASALGKAMLAYLNADNLDRALNEMNYEQFTESTIVDPAVLKNELSLAKARGYAISVEEKTLGVNSIATAILNHKLEPIGAIGVSAPSCRLPEEKLHFIAGDIMKAARRVSGNIGEVAMSILSDPRPRRKKQFSLRCIANEKPLLGEGPIWIDEAEQILWLDILGPAAHRTTASSGQTNSVKLDEITSVIIPRKEGGYICGTESGLYTMNADMNQKALIVAPEKGIATNRFNDGKCDAKGRLWIGTMAIDASPGKGALYCLDVDHTLTKVEDNIQVSNGLGWSPDNKTFYFTDSGKQSIFAYEYDLETGVAENKRVFASVDDGAARPDGLAVDIEGFVWSAHWDGWRVVRYAPDGSIDRVVELPVPKPTSCAFGGPDRKTLYITSARVRLSALQIEEAPLSGGLFALNTNVQGAPTYAFGNQK